MAFDSVLVALLLAASITSGSAAADPSCTDISISNILDIGNCIGTSANFCASASENGLTAGLTDFTNCAIQGIYKYGSPQGIIKALAPLISITADHDIRTGVNVTMLAGLSLCDPTNCVDALLRNDTCDGFIKVSLPASTSIAECFKTTAVTCIPASPTTTNMIQDLFQAIVCALRELPLDQFRIVIKSSACQLINAVNAAVQSDSSLRLAFMSFGSVLTTSLNVNCPLAG